MIEPWFKTKSEKLDLKNVTCILIDGEDPDVAAAVLTSCGEKCNFHDIILFSYERPKEEKYEYNFVQIDKLTLSGYNKFLVSELHKYLKTDYCLVTQWDGFILNPNAWREEFLNYDYVGAAWHHHGFPEEYLVGNGGFSLRSKKYLETIAQFDYDGSIIEDIFCCRKNRELLIDKGIKFAPVNVADQFSVEDAEYNNQFGFHGKGTIAINFFNRLINSDIWEYIKMYAHNRGDLDELFAKSVAHMHRDPNMRSALSLEIIREISLLTYENDTWKKLIRDQELLIESLEQKNIELTQELQRFKTNN
jgi:hypothetical protein